MINKKRVDSGKLTWKLKKSKRRNKKNTNKWILRNK